MTVRVPLDGGVVVVVAPGTVVVVVVDVVLDGSVEAWLVGAEVDAGGSVEWPDDPHEDSTIAAQAKTTIVGVSRRCRADMMARLVPATPRRRDPNPALFRQAVARSVSLRWLW
ncbi:MAG: hypothetical protein ACP5P1_02285 [Acidimicrobiales bacterium]